MNRYLLKQAVMRKLQKSIVIDQPKGSYQDYKIKEYKALRNYPMAGVKHPTDYGYIKGYTAEDEDGLDVFTGTGKLQGLLTMYRPDVKGNSETKTYMGLTKKELKDVKKEFKPVIRTHVPLKTKQFVKAIKKFKNV